MKKVISLMAITLLVLSGCSTSSSDDPDPTQTPTPPVIVESESDSLTDEEYQATLDRIKANDELEKQLQENNRTEEKSGDEAGDGNDTSDTADGSSENSSPGSGQTVDAPEVLSEAEQVLNNAVAEIARRDANATTFDGEINSYVSTGFPQAIADMTIAAAKDGVSYLADQYEFTRADFVFFSKDEVQWAQTKWNEITAGTSLSSVKVYSESWPYPCRSAEYTYTKNGIKQFIQYTCDDGNQGGPVNFGAHGAIHWFQGFYNPQNMPNWLVEGSATLYGEVLGYGVNNPEGKKILWRGDYILHEALKAGPESIRAEIAKVEVKNPPSAIYTTGRMLYTALIGLHGEDKALEFMKSFGTSSDEKANFLRIYGFTLEEFYQESIPLIAEWAVRDWK